eukprot:TRINITY_DN3849_c0_g1_i5.p1 TRINITY_DN3849_c0_g1~~TRINITY_DN3849_c0_g1_i5.p1  ORF type:complete len:1209 (-),score=288.78 TRINITY_DN3849_c0_g1_i5:32-3637(-)
MGSSRILCAVLLSILLCICNVIGQLTPRQRAEAVVADMSLDEKILFVHGTDRTSPYIGNIFGNVRLNLSSINLLDGPQGVGNGVRSITAFPSALNVASTFDTDLMYRFAEAMAIEHKIKGTNVLLGPMVNIARVPTGGRNFESFGEDPYLASILTSASVRGIQSQPMIACVKHFANNNQEYHRTTQSSNVDERTQWEIYYPAFQAGVEAGTGSVMCSYNKVNNDWACENQLIIDRDLKGRMGFKGFVVSDWRASFGTVKGANAGLDMQMPNSDKFGSALISAVNGTGQVPLSRVDDMVARILAAMYAAGQLDYPRPTGSLTAIAQSPAHNNLARTLAEASCVLLKNDGGILPLSSTMRRIAVFGDAASRTVVSVGGGSGNVIMPYNVAPLAGIRNKVTTATNVTYTTTADVGNTTLLLASSADVAIVFVSTNAAEGVDRSDLSFSPAQENMIKAVAAVQPNTIVVMQCPGAVVLPWANQVRAVISAFLLGQENGNAIANVLFGLVNPSGRLAVTFPLNENQTPIANSPSQYPGVSDQVTYSEGLLVGYRWYDAMGQTPSFPFGHGLSYTQFEYSNIVVVINPSPLQIQVSVQIHNLGPRSGAEVAQLYLTYPDTAGEPPKSLRGVKKVTLSPGATAIVSFDVLKERDLSIWDAINTHDWLLIKGEYAFHIGASSRDLRLHRSFSLDGSDFPTPSPTLSFYIVQQKAYALGISRVIDGGTSTGTVAVLANINNVKGRVWKLTSAGELRSVYDDGMCLDIKGGVTNGALVGLWTCTGNPNQKWNVSSSEWGTIKPAGYSDLCLDSKSAGTAEGTQLDIWTCSNLPHQIWNLMSLASAGPVTASATTTTFTAASTTAPTSSTTATAAGASTITSATQTTVGTSSATLSSSASSSASTAALSSTVSSSSRTTSTSTSSRLSTSSVSSSSTRSGTTSSSSLTSLATTSARHDTSSSSRPSTSATSTATSSIAGSSSLLTSTSTSLDTSTSTRSSSSTSTSASPASPSSSFTSIATSRASSSLSTTTTMSTPSTAFTTTSISTTSTLSSMPAVSLDSATTSLTSTSSVSTTYPSSSTLSSLTTTSTASPSTTAVSSASTSMSSSSGSSASSSTPTTSSVNNASTTTTSTSGVTTRASSTTLSSSTSNSILSTSLMSSTTSGNATTSQATTSSSRGTTTNIVSGAPAVYGWSSGTTLTLVLVCIILVQ